MSNEALEEWPGHRADIEDAALRWQAPRGIPEEEQEEVLEAFAAGAEWEVAKQRRREILRRADQYDGDGRGLVAELARELRERN